MGWITAFSMAFGMFCAIPFPVRRWDERQRARMLVCFPWVGAIIGAIWAFACWLLRRIGFSGVLAGALLTALPLAVHVCRDLKQKQAEQEAAEAAGKSEVM